jgi:hypothetical protein
MGPHNEPLRDRLMAQQEPAPEKLARYRQEVEALLEQLRRRRWWIDAVRAVLTTLGAVVLFPLTALFGAMFLYLVGGTNPEAAWCPAAAGLACLAGAAALVRWFFRRREDDLLLEVKRLQAQGLELEEQLRRPAGDAPRRENER